MTIEAEPSNELYYYDGRDKIESDELDDLYELDASYFRYRRQDSGVDSTTTADATHFELVGTLFTPPRRAVTKYERQANSKYSIFAIHDMGRNQGYDERNDR